MTSETSPLFTTIAQLADRCITPGSNDIVQTRENFIAALNEQFNLNGDMLKTPSLHVMPGEEGLILHIEPHGTTHRLYSPAEQQSLDINERFVNMHDTKAAVLNGLNNVIKMHDAAKSTKTDNAGVKHISLVPGQ